MTKINLTDAEVTTFLDQHPDKAELIKQSDAVFLVSSNRPLFYLGFTRVTFLGRQLYAWLVMINQPQRTELRALRQLFVQRVHVPLVASVENEIAAKFIKFFGFSEIAETWYERKV